MIKNQGCFSLRVLRGFVFLAGQIEDGQKLSAKAGQKFHPHSTINAQKKGNNQHDGNNQI